MNPGTVDWLRWYEEEDAGERDEDAAKTEGYCHKNQEVDAFACRQCMRVDIRKSAEMNWEE